MGVRQVFVRLCGCNLRCTYCDTPEARKRTASFPVDGRKGRRRSVINPVAVPELSQLISYIWDASFHSVSFTGGEPLLQAAELAELLPRLAETAMRIYLETNGTLYQELEAVLPWVDHIAMDIKLPSSQGGANLLERHRRFLARALCREVFLKVVVDVLTEEEELDLACRLLAKEGGGITLVLQPATPAAGEEGISLLRAERLYGVAAASFEDVRIIPQMHRKWGVR